MFGVADSKAATPSTGVLSDGGLFGKKPTGGSMFGVADSKAAAPSALVKSEGAPPVEITSKSGATDTSVTTTKTKIDHAATDPSRTSSLSSKSTMKGLVAPNTRKNVAQVQAARSEQEWLVISSIEAVKAFGDQIEKSLAELDATKAITDDSGSLDQLQR